jgi:hypothetical protein
MTLVCAEDARTGWGESGRLAARRSGVGWFRVAT